MLMGGWVGGGWVSGNSGWVCGMRLDCDFCCFCFSCGGDFGVLLCYFWCETVVVVVVGGMWVGR